MHFSGVKYDCHCAYEGSRGSNDADAVAMFDVTQLLK